MQKLNRVLLFFFLLQISNSFSYIQTFNSTIDMEERGDGTPNFGSYYETVHIYCLPDRCELVCYQPGVSYECDWEFATTCHDCEDSWAIYDNTNSSELFNYAKNQIAIGTYNGTYNNNIYIIPLGITIYRNVNWSIDMNSMKSFIDITVTDGN
ncbi:hypothetical protein MASR1M45_23290 [Candidatus Kapaibacterium sp.]